MLSQLYLVKRKMNKQLELCQLMISYLSNVRRGAVLFKEFLAFNLVKFSALLQEMWFKVLFIDIAIVNAQNHEHLASTFDGHSVDEFTRALSSNHFQQGGAKVVPDSPISNNLKKKNLIMKQVSSSVNFMRKEVVGKS